MLMGTLAVLAALAGGGAATPDARALAFLNDIVHGDDGAVVTHFDPTMRGALSAEGLNAAWGAYQLQFGGYAGHGEPERVSLGRSIVVRIPLEMSHKWGEFRITFEQGGEIAGLFLRTGVPL